MIKLSALSKKSIKGFAGEVIFNRGYDYYKDYMVHDFEYGINDRPLEDLAIETMDLLVDLLNNNPDLVERRKKIQAKLEKYCEWGNCGITDDICDASYELSEDESQ